MEITFLTLDEILELHGDQIERFGGEPSIRDMGLLDSAMNMPRAQFGGEFMHEFPHAMAAAYLFHIAANHPFVDGNKRTALAASLVFLEINGFIFAATKIETGDMVLAVASGKRDKAACTAFFEKHVRASSSS